MSSSNQDPPLSWEYLAGWFDVNGSVYEKRTRGWLEARLRFSSYDRDFLEKIRLLVGGGSITPEPRSKGLYFRLTVTGYYRVDRILANLLPHLRRKREEIKRWLTLHKVKAEIGRLKRKLRLKPRKYLSRDPSVEAGSRSADTATPRGNGLDPLPPMPP